MPTDAYPLEAAVKDGYLVPMRALSVPLNSQRQGIRYDDLSDDEKETWGAIEWDEEDGTPDHVDPQALNKWLFNEDTVDKALAHLMTHGQHVEAGDRLGKTAIQAQPVTRNSWTAAKQHRADVAGTAECLTCWQRHTDHPASLIDGTGAPNSISRYGQTPPSERPVAAPGMTPTHKFRGRAQHRPDRPSVSNPERGRHGPVRSQVGWR